MKTIIKIFWIILISLSHEVSFCQSITWQRTYGESIPEEVGYSIVQLPDEGYIAVGRKGTSSFGMRLDKFGNVIWGKQFPGFQADQIIKTYDNNYLIGGDQIVKINIDGDIVWIRPQTTANNFKFTKDNGFFVASASQVGSLYNPSLRKFDSLGFLQWERVYSDSIYDGYFSNMLIDSIGNLILIGNISDSAFITAKPLIMKTDSLGNQIWFHRYDDLWYHYIDFIFPHQDGGYLVTADKFVYKFDDNGILQWSRIYYNPDSVEINNCTIKTLEGDYASTGFLLLPQSFTYYIGLVKTDYNGNIEWRTIYGFGDADFGNSIYQTSDSGYVMIGIRDNFNNGDMYIVKTDKNGYASPPVYINTIFNFLPDQYKLFQNYPNPFNPETTINYELPISTSGSGIRSYVSIKVYDVLGKEVQTLVNEYQNPGSHIIKFNGNNLSSGIYYYSLLVDEKLIDTKKMLYIK